MGASPGESATGLDRELVGSKSRWFGVDDEGDDVCILPVSMAQIVGIDTNGVVRRRWVSWGETGA